MTGCCYKGSQTHPSRTSVCPLASSSWKTSLHLRYLTEGLRPQFHNCDLHCTKHIYLNIQNNIYKNKLKKHLRNMLINQRHKLPYSEFLCQMSTKKKQSFNCPSQVLLDRQNNLTGPIKMYLY